MSTSTEQTTTTTLAQLEARIKTAESKIKDVNDSIGHLVFAVWFGSLVIVILLVAVYYFNEKDTHPAPPITVNVYDKPIHAASPRKSEANNSTNSTSH